MPVLSECSLKSDLLRRARPAEWSELRVSAEARLEAQDLPTTRQEDWKYLDLRPLQEMTFLPAGLPCPDIQQHILPEARGARLVFMNGRFDPHHSAVHGLPGGLRFLSLAQACELAHELGTLALPGDSDLFTNLNTARFEDGALIRVPRGMKVDAPLHVLFLTRHEGEGTGTALPRLLVVLEPGSDLQLVEEHAGLGRYLTAPVVEVIVHEGARLRHERIQREAPEACHFGSLTARVARNAAYHSRTVTLGGLITRQAPRVRLDEGAVLDLDGLVLLKGSQVADTHSFIDHATPHGTSRQLHKCIADDRSRAVFNGQILVRPGAQATDARQQSRNLLLSEAARIDTKPQLEIYADDVKCAHGAAIGQLDPEELFYLESRGMSPDLARKLLTFGFASDLLGRIPVTSLRRQLRAAVLDLTQASAELEGV